MVESIGDLLLEDPTAIYDFMSRHLQQLNNSQLNSQLRCLNLGELRAQAEFNPNDLNQLGLRLYETIVSGVNLAEKSVLEIGCGRGGGAFHLWYNHSPHSYTGVDLSAHNIAFCNTMDSAPGLSFREGNALALDFAGQSFDIAISIEVSHHCEPFSRFLSEAKRVLKPRGVLCMRVLAQSSELAGQLSDIAAVFPEFHYADMTESTGRSLNATSDSKRKLIDMVLTGELSRFRSHFYEFAAVRGSAVYNNYLYGTGRTYSIQAWA
jgi:ubiquinone/menaquinone biosynthesis C-methylase UbiE